MKKSVLLGLCVMSTVAMSMTAYAGQWFKDNGRWAYQDDSGNQIKEGWFTDTDGKVYNFTGGVVRSGWYKENNHWYYFDPTSGERRSGWINDDGKWYWCNFLGIKETGWIMVNGQYYYLQGDGSMYADKLVDINGNKYYFHPDGHMARNEYVKDNTNYAGADGIIATSTWVDEDTYVNGSGKVTDNTKTDKVEVENKVYSLAEYQQMGNDAAYRYVDLTSELHDLINQYREEYNEDKVWDYDGDDDTYIERNELPEFDYDDNLDKAASVRAAELASQQRASGARPDGRDMETVLSDYGIAYTNVGESVAFGQNDIQYTYDDLESSSTHTSMWKNKKYTKMGVGLAYDVDGKPYWVILYVE